MRYGKGDVVKWQTDFGGAMIEVEKRIPGAGGAHVGNQLPERRRVIFYANEVVPVKVSNLVNKIAAEQREEE